MDDNELDDALARVRDELERGHSRAAPVSPIAGRVSFRHVYLNSLGEKEWATTYVYPKDLLFVRTGVKSGAVEAHLADGSVLEGVRQTFKELEPKLAPHGFFLIHRSFLVNLAQIYCLKPGVGDETHRAVVRGASGELPVAREKWGELIKVLEQSF